MAAAEALTKWPSFLRPFVHWFLPEVRTMKAEASRARQIVSPVFAKRREENRIAHEAGERTSNVADAIGWLDEAAKGRAYDDGLMQLGLAFAAIHTTSELLSGIISDICDHPRWFEPLREEMCLAINTHGWSKKALQDMKLTDSTMKESQRHHLGDIGGYQIFRIPIFSLLTYWSSGNALCGINSSRTFRRNSQSQRCLHNGCTRQDGRSCDI